MIPILIFFGVLILITGIFTVKQQTAAITIITATTYLTARLAVISKIKFSEADHSNITFDI